jgi:hypothetical protein
MGPPTDRVGAVRLTTSGYEIPGTVGLTHPEHGSPVPTLMSRARGGRRSRPMGLRPEQAKGGSTDQVGLGIEGVVDNGMGGEESLGGALGLELLLLPFSSPDLDAIARNAGRRGTRATSARPAR